MFVSAAVLNTLLTLAVGLAGLAAFITTFRRSVGSEWKANAEAHEERIKVLTVQVEDLQRQQFTQNVLFADAKRESAQHGLRSLDLQRQVDRLARREKQLVAALAAAGIPVPAPLEDSE